VKEREERKIDLERNRTRRNGEVKPILNRLSQGNRDREKEKERERESERAEPSKD
jgi:hypothetical protein